MCACLHIPQPVTKSVQGEELESLIGNTPLIRLRRVIRNLSPGVQVYVKAEWFNPGGSVKDRPAWNMIRVAEQDGQLTPDKIIIDATSGNTGIAYAMIGAARGYRVQLCLPANANPERKRILRAFGAELILTDPREQTDGAIRRVQQIVEADPERYFYPDQYNNPANWQAHYNGTGVEIWQQTQGEVTHFVAGMGTTGTLMGTGRRLKEYNPRVRLVAVQPDGPFHGLEGLKHLETALVPGIYDPTVPDEQMEVSTESAHAMARLLAREEGLFVGISAAGAICCALRVAESLSRGVVVALAPDGGSRYITDPLWEEEG
ncbi:MAG: cysteine synthase family protein [Chthonomonadetes bacterium]|nr:cysteine synthase family protein [Chthonomonadetes bacterium]